uniref:KRAB domain-containing protein n=1 Tax=Salvator merianae TaxID=96440 RepID=A0A8D0E9A3_SALMN
MASSPPWWPLVSFEDVSVSFSPEEWALLHPWQKKLHWEVMMENYKMLISLGKPSVSLSGQCDAISHDSNRQSGHF